MKFIVSLILTALLSFALCLFLPWWSIAIAALIVAAAVPQRPFKAFMAGFIALFLLWGGLSFWKSSANGHILAGKMNVLILNTQASPWVIILITALIGALVGGMAALAGSYIRKR